METALWGLSFVHHIQMLMVELQLLGREATGPD